MRRVIIMMKIFKKVDESKVNWEKVKEKELMEMQKHIKDDQEFMIHAYRALLADLKMNSYR
jgi:SepF-like predicted cell division protein (DUF552 family)